MSVVPVVEVLEIIFYQYLVGKNRKVYIPEAL